MKKYSCAFIVMILILLAFVGFLHFYRCADKQENVQFEFVSRLNKIKEFQWDYWFMVNDNKGTDIDTQTLAKFCDLDGLEMDFENYTYIVVDGYELTDLYYKGSDCRRRFSISPDYYGYATLKKSDDVFYVYRVPSGVPIIKDLHAHYEDDFRTTILQ